MRVDNDLRKSVLFVGHGSPDNFTAVGTAFVLLHNLVPYLVTAAHVAESLGDEPFIIRLNSNGGDGACLFALDPTEVDERARWFLHSDPNVDVAVMPFHLDFDALGAECVAILGRAAVEAKNPMEDAGCGDYIYVIGLFARQQGRSRNLPVVHTGHLALMPNSAEPIESRSADGKVRKITGYLVEISSLMGLSGAPVFVRSGIQVSFPIEGGGASEGIMASPTLKLLGVWQGSWDGLSFDRGLRVPVGMGIVTPVERLLELLDSPPLEQNRKAWSSTRAD